MRVKVGYIMFLPDFNRKQPITCDWLSSGWQILTRILLGTTEFARWQWPGILKTVSTRTRQRTISPVCDGNYVLVIFGWPYAFLTNLNVIAHYVELKDGF